MCDWSGSCCTMAKQLKGGYLLRYKKKIFGKTWKEEWVVLYENSSLVWYKDRDRPSPEGGMLLKEAPELLAVGLWTLRIPTRPDLPDGCHTRQLMAFGTPGKEKVHWFLCKSEDEVNEWMTAISNTLPPPPTMPKSDDVISTPSRLKKTEILSHLMNHKSTDLISSSCLLDYHLPKTASLGSGIMNAHHHHPQQQQPPQPQSHHQGKSSTTPSIAGSKSSSNSSNSSSTASLLALHQRPLGKTANGHLHQHLHHNHHHHQPSHYSSKNGLSNGHYHHSSSGALSSLDKVGSDDIASTLTMSTALGYWSHGFGWGWGPGWGWSGWGTNTSMSLSGSDYSNNFRSHYDHSGYNGGDSNGYHHVDSVTGGFGGSDLTDNLDIGMDAVGLDDSLLDSAGSAFDAFGGDFGF